jgi:hypothetical protein
MFTDMVVLGKGVGQRMVKNKGISSLFKERIGNEKARGA